MYKSNFTLISCSTDQKITEEVFPILDKDTITELIPLVGERLLFNVKFKTEIQNAKVNKLRMYK